MFVVVRKGSKQEVEAEKGKLVSPMYKSFAKANLAKLSSKKPFLLRVMRVNK